MKKQKALRVGFDFDGVIAYNPFRVIRAPVSKVKREIFGVKKLTFWYPKHPWQQLFWKLLHESSVFPARGTTLLRQLVKEKHIEAHLITARYSFLEDNLYQWLDRYHLRDVFTSITLNAQNAQPHVFKETVINKKKLDAFVEDNLDIVSHLHGKSTTKIFWIYNIVDRAHPHPLKFPYLEKALTTLFP